MSGFIALQRDAVDHPGLRDANLFGAWCLLLAAARWSPRSMHGIGRTLPAGHILCTCKGLAARLCWNELSAKRCLRSFERSGLLTLEMIGRRTLIIIQDRSTFVLDMMQGDGPGEIDPTCGFVPAAVPVFGREREPISETTRSQVFARDGRICTYCCTIEGPFEIDHIIAVANGGSNHLDNLCVACKPCNRSKGALSLKEWTA